MHKRDGAETLKLSEVVMWLISQNFKWNSTFFKYSDQTYGSSILTADNRDTNQVERIKIWQIQSLSRQNFVFKSEVELEIVHLLS